MTTHKRITLKLCNKYMTWQQQGKSVDIEIAGMKLTAIEVSIDTSLHEPLYRLSTLNTLFQSKEQMTKSKLMIWLMTKLFDLWQQCNVIFGDAPSNEHVVVHKDIIEPIHTTSIIHPDTGVIDSIEHMVSRPIKAKNVSTIFSMKLFTHRVFSDLNIQHNTSLKQHVGNTLLLSNKRVQLSAIIAIYGLYHFECSMSTISSYSKTSIIAVYEILNMIKSQMNRDEFLSYIYFDNYKELLKLNDKSISNIMNFIIK